MLSAERVRCLWSAATCVAAYDRNLDSFQQSRTEIAGFEDCVISEVFPEFVCTALERAISKVIALNIFLYAISLLHHVGRDRLQRHRRDLVPLVTMVRLAQDLSEPPKKIFLFQDALCTSWQYSRVSLTA